MRVVAQHLTPAGPAGVAVIELRGPETGQALHRLGVASDLLPGQVGLVRLETGAGRGSAGASEALDEALLVVHDSERVELHIHGSPPLVDEILTYGECRGPVVGSDIEHQAWELLPGAASELGARVLLDQAQGALRRALERLRRPSGSLDRSLLADLVRRGRVSKCLLKPTRIVLCGAANAGKSTLFNALVGEQRVLATPVEGTTRDAVREHAWLGPWPVELVDTAGERGPADEIEAAGQALGRELVDRADWAPRLAAHGAAPGPSQAPVDFLSLIHI